LTVLVLTRYGCLGASSRMRTFQFMPYLKESGIEYVVHPLFNDGMLSRKYQKNQYNATAVLVAYFRRIAILRKWKQFDLVWIEKEALPWLPFWLEKALLRHLPYILDYDDAVFHNYDMHSSYWMRRFMGNRLDRLMAGARLVICGNRYLAKRARNAGVPWVEVIPTVIDLNRYTPNAKKSSEDIVPRIVWIGSPSTVHYVKLLHKPLQILREHCKFKLRIIGAKLDLPGVDVEYADWSESSEVSTIQGCQVGVMPLTDTPWEQGKCGYKLIQYMACSLPVVASPVGVNTDIVRPEINGYLAGSDEEWVAALQTLIRNTRLRDKMGSAGRKIVEDQYCVQKIAPRLSQLLSQAMVN